ncbi:hypothetical protein ABPG72_007046 [Tetrahymena utriculariae]
MSYSEQKQKNKDCPEVVCEKTDPLGTYRKFAQQPKTMKFKDEDTDDHSNSSVELEKSEDKVAQDDPYKYCPNNKQSLGFFTWNFLHTMAIYYPKNPTEEEKQKIKNFFDSFATFYPCKPCALHFQKDILKTPPAVESNESLSIWLCERHNLVNKWLGKQQFDCSFENLEKRWRTGYDHCKDQFTKLQ